MTYPAHPKLPAEGSGVNVVPLSAIPAAWDADWADLADGASEPNPFYEHWLMRPAIRHLKPIPQDRMIGVWRDEALIGMLPVTQSRRYGRIPLRHVENWIHYHCFFGAPLVRAGYETIFWGEVLTLLDRADWAPNFLHVVGLDPAGPVFAGLRAARRTDCVHRSQRAVLSSDLQPQPYYEANVRPKKRKEIRRLRSRLDELGEVEFEHLAKEGLVEPWIADFLDLESSGWKGREGSALSDNSATKMFFEETIASAHRVGKLDMLRLTLDGKPIAMLVNFITPPGAYAFKIAFDENYARFSPGVLIKVENLNILDRKDIHWADSCAAEDHPMINSLWAERREIVRVTVPLAGARRKVMFDVARGLERLSARLRGRQ